MPHIVVAIQGSFQIVNPTLLRIPDYAGNGMFNTLGNFAENPRVGLVIPDFKGGRKLQLTGRAPILWDVDDPSNATGGTRRYWDFEIDHWIQIENSLPGTSEFLDLRRTTQSWTRTEDNRHHSGRDDDPGG